MPKTIHISRTAWMDAEETILIMRALCGQDGDAGTEARFVGGCVRDALLNRKSYDVDIAVNYPPDETIARLNAAKIKAIPTGIEHGTVTGVINGQPFEITTLRRDVETDGRKAQVEFTDDWQEDASRRDFTMNALYANVAGEVTDYFTGIDDAKRGYIQFIGDADARICEDYLRILRFYRFFAHFGKSAPDETAREGCKVHAGQLNTLSGERVATELFKLLSARDPTTTVEMMLEDGVFTSILTPIKDVTPLGVLVGLEYKTESLVFPVRRLASLIGFDVKASKEIATALKLSNVDRASLVDLCDEENQISPDTPDAALRKQVYKHGIDRVRNRILMTAAMRSDASLEVAEAHSFVTKTRLPDFPINGQDIIDRGLKEGKAVGDTLKMVENWWIESDFAVGRTACLEYLDGLISRRD